MQSEKGGGLLISFIFLPCEACGPDISINGIKAAASNTLSLP